MSHHHKKFLIIATAEISYICSVAICCGSAMRHARRRATRHDRDKRNSLLSGRRCKVAPPHPHDTHTSTYHLERRVFGTSVTESNPPDPSQSA